LVWQTILAAQRELQQRRGQREAAPSGEGAASLDQTSEEAVSR